MVLNDFLVAELFLFDNDPYRRPTHGFTVQVLSFSMILLEHRNHISFVVLNLACVNPQ